MTVIALTGGVAAGKSTVTRVLEECGALVIDADVLARKAVEPGSNGLQRVVQAFGDTVLHPDGSLNRAALGDIVFRDDEARSRLNEIVHPIVKQLYSEAVATAEREHPHRVLIYAVPLLAEARSAEEFDAVVVVHAPAETRVQRLIENRGLSDPEARLRVEAQATDAERLELADVVLDATGYVASTERAAHELYDELKALWPDRLHELSRRFPRESS